MMQDCRALGADIKVVGKMNIMLLAPQPFYQDRGTPIAVDMVLKVLSERGDRVDVVTYHEGDDVDYDGITINRISTPPLVHGVPPGFSWKKFVCDAYLLVKAIRMAFSKNYQVVHAVEESVLIALLLKRLFNIPYVYDMDSSFAQQMIEKYPWLAAAPFLLNFLEGLAVRNAKAVVPVCDALAETIERHLPRKVVVLNDVSLLKELRNHEPEDLTLEFGMSGPLLMYVGNLEVYQGIDLLLESFALALDRVDCASLAIIGGKPKDIEKYRAKSQSLGVHENVYFLGPRPVEYLNEYLSQADILVSPRTKGQNTPMKLYSYLHSGKAVLATDLPTHTQVLSRQVSMLARPTPEDFSEAMVSLIGDSALRTELGDGGKRLIEERYTYAAFRERLNGLYDWLTDNPAEKVYT